VFDIGPEKLLMVLVIALIFLGPQKLPEIARSLGKGLREIRQAGQAARDELMEGLDADGTPPILKGPVAQDEESADASASNGSAGTAGSAEERPDPERTGRSG
jgi:Tat protein translocase TatB subunit